MNVWLVAGTVLMGGLVPCGFVCLRGTHMDAVAGLELACTITTLVLLLLAEGFGRSSYFELPLTLAVLTFIGGLVFVRVTEHWL